jgi:Tol biopolymer transport system component/subtilisin-like proprotein convertase family protein
VAFDTSGSVLVAGSIVAFPGPVDGVQTTPGGLGDLLVVKFSAAGARLAATWLGTNALEQVNDLAVHLASGDVIVSGVTFSSQFPTTAGAYQPACSGVVGQATQCAYLARLSGDLKSLRFSTFFGPSLGAYIDGIAVDADNSLVLAGGIQANAIPATTGDTTHNGGTDAFLARMSGNGATLSMLTYLGGGQFDAAVSVAIDAAGDLYVAGSTASTGFPVSQGALKTQLGGTQDGFLTKFLPDGSAVKSSSLIGSAGFDVVSAVTVTPRGDVYLVGQAGGSGLAVTADALDPTFSQRVGEAFLYRLSPQFDSEFSPSQTTPVALADAVVLGAGTVPGVTNSTLVVGAAVGELERIEVSMHVTHAVRRQLQATLIGPATGPATQVVLFTNNGVPTGANFGSSCAVRTVFSDTAQTSITTSLAPSAGTFVPANPLSPFSGRAASQINGTWTLRLTDTVAGTAGTLQCWGLTLYFRRPDITSVTPGGSGVPSPGSVITIAGRNFVAGATVRVGGLPAAVRDTTATLISAVMPAGVGASPHVAVTNPDGRSAFAADPFNRVSFTRSKLGSQRQGEAGFSDLPTLQPVLSRNGRWLAFKSFATLMVNGDTNNQPDIFVRDRGTGGTRIVRVSMGLNGQQANGPSDRPRISADGRYVAFVSAATNLVVGDLNGQPDVFLHDRDTDADGIYDEAGATRTFRVSVASTGAQANGPSADPDLSPDGFWVAFTSTATNLVPGDTNAVQDVFLHHWPSGQTERVSVATGGGQANRASFSPGVSAGGRRVVFSSDATNLVAGDGNGLRDVFLRERLDGSTVRVSTAAGSTADANGASDNPSIDDRGLTIAFETRATNVTPALAGQAVVRSQVVVMRLPAVTPFDEIRAGADGRVGLAVVDIAAALRNLLSGSASGQPGNGDSTSAEVNGDGSGVAFESDSTDIVSDDTNGVQDVFVASTSGGEPERVSVDEQDQQGDEPSQEAALSDDGSAVAFESEAGLTSNTQGTDFTNVFVRGNKLLIDTIVPNALTLSGGDITITGAGFVPPMQVRIGGVSATVKSENSTQIVATVPASSTAGPVNVGISNSDGETTTAINAFTYLASGTDSDQDGLPDAFEQLFGLDPTSGAGQNGAGGDPDGDGVTNAEEFARGTHPKGSFQRFLAEGAATDFFTTRISLANPSDNQAVTALLRFQRSNGTELSRAVKVEPRQIKKVTVNQVPGMVPAEFATLVESDGLLVVDRQMSWDTQNAYGSHAEGAVRAPATIWYLAEGATHSGFDLFYLLQNPSTTTAAQVLVRYLLPSGAPLEKAYTVPPGSRFNIWVDVEQFPAGSGNTALSNTDVSAVLQVTNDVPIIVERAMYLSRGQLFTAGHESAGINEPALSWFLAEGATLDTFDMFVLLANPNPTASVATVSYLLENGAVLTRTITVAPNSRQNIWVNFDTPDGTTGFPLRNVALSTKVEVTNGVPIIVERAMWWPTDSTRWYEAHNSPGSTVTGTLWALAEGVVQGSPSNTATYILVANTSAQAASVAVTLLFDGRAPVTRNFTISANSRKTLDIGFEFPEAQGLEFGALVESLGTVPAQIVVERALYNDALGQSLAAGSNQLATRLR